MHAAKVHGDAHAHDAVMGMPIGGEDFWTRMRELMKSEMTGNNDTLKQDIYTDISPSVSTTLEGFGHAIERQTTALQEGCSKERDSNQNEGVE